MNRYILYARKSDEDRNNQVRSIEDQKKELQAAIKAAGLSVVAILDEEKSAKVAGNRPEFDRMVAMIRKGTADAILVWSVNRLARNMTEGGMLQDMLSCGQIGEIRTPHQAFRPGDNILPFVLEIAQAAQYSLSLAVDVRRGLRNKVADGQYPQRAREGYLNVSRVVGDKLQSVIDIDPERFHLLRKAWDLLLTGEYSISRIQKVMNDEWGYTTRKSFANQPVKFRRIGGVPIAKSTLHKVFTSIFYTGYFYHKSAGGELVKGIHRPMISTTEFQRAQEILGRSGKQRPRRREFAYTGMLTCGRCGCSVTAECKPGKNGRGPYIYYRCTNMRGRCNYKCLREEDLEAKIRLILDTIEFDAEAVEIARRNIAAIHLEESEKWQAIFEQRRRRMEEAKRRLSALLDMRLDGQIDAETYDMKKDELQAEVNRLKLEEGGAEITADCVRQGCEEVVRFCELAPKAFRVGTLEQRRAVTRALGVNFTVTDGQVGIELNPLFRPVCKASLEHHEMGSDNKKDGSFEPSVPLGRGERTSLESLRQVWCLLAGKAGRAPLLGLLPGAQSPPP